MKQTGEDIIGSSNRPSEQEATAVTMKHCDGGALYSTTSGNSNSSSSSNISKSINF